jgi:hypothetical protein
MAEQTAECVVARKPILQLKKTAEIRFLRFGEFRHVHRTLASAQHRAQRDDQKLMEIMPTGIAASGIIQAVPTGGKLLQGNLAGRIFDDPW